MKFSSHRVVPKTSWANNEQGREFVLNLPLVPDDIWSRLHITMLIQKR